MIPEEKFNQEVWLVLNKIKERSFHSGKDGVIKYYIKSPPDIGIEGMPFPNEEMEIIGKLQDWGAINKISPNDVAEVSDSETALSKGQNVFIVILYLKTLQPKFDEVYQEYQAKKLPVSVRQNEVSMYQTPQGELFRYDGQRRLGYPMTENGIRHKIMNALIENNGYMKTSKIAGLAGTNATTVRKEIGGIRTQITKRLHIDGKEVIVGKMGSGYKLNHRIKRVEE